MESEEFERKRKERDEQADAKTSKNRAKRMKKKERAKGKGKDSETPQDTAASSASGATGESPIKKRRLVNGNEIVFKLPGGDSDVEDQDESPEDICGEENVDDVNKPEETVVPVVQPNITIYDSDT